MFLNAKINLLFTISHRFNINKSISRCLGPTMSNAVVVVMISKHMAIPAIVTTVAIDILVWFQREQISQISKMKNLKISEKSAFVLEDNKKYGKSIVTSKFFIYCINSQYIYLQSFPISIEIAIHHFR